MTWLPSPHRGRGAGGEGDALSGTISPLTPTPSPPVGRGGPFLAPHIYVSIDQKAAASPAMEWAHPLVTPGGAAAGPVGQEAHPLPTRRRLGHHHHGHGPRDLVGRSDAVPSRRDL